MISMDLKQQILHYYRVDELSLQEKLQQVFESSKDSVIVPSRMYFDNPDEPFEF